MNQAPTTPDIIPDDLVTGVANTLKHLVADVTNPTFREHVRLVLTDAAEVQRLITSGATPGLINRARAHLNAGALSMLKTPAYAAANRQDELLSHGWRILDGVFSYGFDVAARAADGYLKRLAGSAGQPAANPSGGASRSPGGPGLNASGLPATNASAGASRPSGGPDPNVNGLPNTNASAGAGVGTG